MGMLSAREEMVRKNFYLSSDLAGRAEAVAKTLDLDFSQLAREALHQFVARAEREALEQELAEACDNYREFNKQFSSEWARFETRVE